MPDIDTSNKFLVGVNGDSILFMRPVPPRLTYDDALLLAAYLVALADRDDKFQAVLEAVQNT